MKPILALAAALTLSQLAACNCGGDVPSVAADGSSLLDADGAVGKDAAVEAGADVGTAEEIDAALPDASTRLHRSMIACTSSSVSEGWPIMK